MFWDNVAGIYDYFINATNRRTYRALCKEVANYIGNEDNVLECACGTGVLSLPIAQKAKHLTATDFSEGMLCQTQKKCAHLSNIMYAKTDITALPYEADCFDKVVAGNVIHLLDQPEQALAELVRVCKPDGLIIIPTFVNKKDNGRLSPLVKLLDKIGAGFKQQFTYESYCDFICSMGYNATFSIVEGKLSCAIAVIKK